MIRILPRLLWVACLLLCLVLAAGWLRSHFTTDVMVAGHAGGPYYELATLPGQLRVSAAKYWPREEPARWYRAPALPPTSVFGHRVVPRWYPPGVGVLDGQASAVIDSPGGGLFRVTGPVRTVAVPFPLALLACAAYPALRLWYSRRRRLRTDDRRRRGLCLGCGYDLRAATARCPECGRPTETALAAARRTT